MDKFRKTLSLRKKKDRSQEEDPNSKPVSWQEDERKVRDGCCSFQVKYLGHIEVFDSRGMQVCEEAIKALRRPKKKTVRAILYVSGDTIRVSDEISKGLIVDQTIEKVSFCSPDRNHKKGFAYICRDGTTRRWMCHAFLAVKESGERLSHAVGCAFAICLEKKQKRESEVSQLSAGDPKSVTKTNSFRQTSLSERLLDPQSVIIVEPPLTSPLHPPAVNSTASSATPSLSSAINTAAVGCGSPGSAAAAVPRPHASASFFSDRQTSLRMFPKLQESSPFKRELSLRLAELPNSSPNMNLARDLDMNHTTVPSSLVAGNNINSGNTTGKITEVAEPEPCTVTAFATPAALTASAAGGWSDWGGTSKSQYTSDTSASESPAHFRQHSSGQIVQHRHKPQQQQQQMSSSLILSSTGTGQHHFPVAAAATVASVASGYGSDSHASLGGNVPANPFLLTGIVNYGVSSGFSSQEALAKTENIPEAVTNSTRHHESALATGSQPMATAATIDRSPMQRLSITSAGFHDNQPQSVPLTKPVNGFSLSSITRNSSVTPTDNSWMSGTTGGNRELSSTNPWSDTNTVNLPANTSKQSSPLPPSSHQPIIASTADPFDISWLGRPNPSMTSAVVSNNPFL